MVNFVVDRSCRARGSYDTSHYQELPLANEAVKQQASTWSHKGVTTRMKGKSGAQVRNKQGGESGTGRRVTQKEREGESGTGRGRVENES